METFSSSSWAPMKKKKGKGGTDEEKLPLGDEAQRAAKMEEAEEAQTGLPPHHRGTHRRAGLH